MPADIIKQYLDSLDRIYGMYMEACFGFEHYGKQLTGQIRGQTKRDSSLFYGSGSPMDADARYQHVTTFGEAIDRNQRDGSNQQLVTTLVIVYIYTLWDTWARPNYAEKLGIDQSKITSNLFGDLRHYRHAILHNGWVLDREPTRLNFLKIGDEIALSRDQMHDLFAMLFEEISVLHESITGQSLKKTFHRKLNPKG